ncbi:YceI family protein [Longibacter sp.]|jgi:polyisoprenoid-binding protein YceI|uniref:YceI family protein n=1 Tax=Longibacter sp. TaxID=2045415 RepID=UPI003EBEF704
MTQRLSVATAILSLLLFSGFAFLQTNPAASTEEVDIRSDEPVAWTLDEAHSEVRFRVRHLAISSVTGFFRDFDASVTMTPDDLSTLSASANARIQSIDTGNTDRDDHLRSPDFFDAERFPEMSFESTGVSDVNGEAFTLNGRLTIRDVTRTVSFDGTMIGTAVGPKGKQRAAIAAETVINRKDFGLTWNKLTEAGGVIVGDDVTIELDVQLVRADV